MPKDKPGSRENSKHCKEAEAGLSLKQKRHTATENSSRDADAALLHELQIHQIQLAMQNEDLRPGAQHEAVLTARPWLNESLMVFYNTIR